MIDKLVLQTGAEIPFPAGKLIIHPPTLYEIGLIGGEEVMWEALDVLTVNKNLLTNVDKNVIEQSTNFDIIMSIMLDKSPSVKKQSIMAVKLLSIIFPDYVLSIKQDRLSFKQLNSDNEGFLNANNFDEFQQIIKQLFVLKKIKGEEFKPVDKKAAEIAAKIQAGRNKAAAAQAKKSGGKRHFFIDRYISILSVGENKNQTDICKLTIYQLFEEFDRYQANLAYESNIRARLAGATGLQDPKNWMEDLQAKEQSN